MHRAHTLTTFTSRLCLHFQVVPSGAQNSYLCRSASLRPLRRSTTIAPVRFSRAMTFSTFRIPKLVPRSRPKCFATTLPNQLPALLLTAQSELAVSACSTATSLALSSMSASGGMVRITTPTLSPGPPPTPLGRSTRLRKVPPRLGEFTGARFELLFQLDQ